MFAYTDPGKTLKPAAALKNYRLALHMEYAAAARTNRSAFTLLEAFQEISPAKIQTASVEWLAFPRSAQATNELIDRDRFQLQDEYVEWRVQRAQGRPRVVTFSTDFLAYYEALARAGADALKAGVRAVMPSANPTNVQLFGPGFNPARASEEARAKRFVAFARKNPWINGEKGILCLAHGSSTLGALFGLVNAAAVPNQAIPPGAICETLGGDCVPSRNSDPSIASAVQSVAAGDNSLTLADPVGVEIARLAGVWRIGDTEIDINDPPNNQGIWKVTRQGRRGELRIPNRLFVDDSPVESGAQVASLLRVRARVIAARNSDLPAWARTGNESSQRLAKIAGAE